MPLKPNKKTCHNLLEDTVKGLNTGVTFDHVLCKNTWSNVSWERWIKCIVGEVLGKIVVYGCDWSFENLSGSHRQSQVKNCFLVKCCYSGSCNLIGRLTFWSLSFFIQILNSVHQPDLEYLTNKKLFTWPGWWWPLRLPNRQSLLPNTTLI